MSQETVLKALKIKKEGLTSKEISKFTKVGISSVLRACKKLRGLGEIKIRIKYKKGRKYNIYYI